MRKYVFIIKKIKIKKIYNQHSKQVMAIQLFKIIIIKMKQKYNKINVIFRKRETFNQK